MRKNTVTTKDSWGRELTYEVVEKIPPRFSVWNIGEHMGSDEYIPLCELVNPCELEEQYRDLCAINPNTLKAIKLPKEEVLLLRKAAMTGIRSLNEAHSVIRKSAKTRYSKKRRRLAVKALAIFERITA